MRRVSVYPRAGRRALHVSFSDPLTGKRVERASPFRATDPDGRRKARAWAEDLARQGSDRAHSGEEWQLWVVPFIERRYAGAKRTRERYLGAWKFLHHWLVDVAVIRSPRALTYRDVLGFHEWRTAMVKPSSGRVVSNNTAILDIKVLQTIMAEAVRRDFASVNPCQRLGLRRDPPRSARELSAEELALIEEALPRWVAEDESERAWMATAYTIARFQGCRLRETQLDLRRQVNLRTGEITFLAKGSHGRVNEFTTMMHPRVRALMETLCSERGRQRACVVPLQGSRMWRAFFDSIGLRDAWFHCLRATVATEMARGGVPLSQAMRYMGHASAVIHRAYQRLRARDLGDCVAAIG